MGLAKDEYFSTLRRFFLIVESYAKVCADAVAPGPHLRSVFLALSFSAGVGLYFSLMAEPPLWVGLGGAGLCVSICAYALLRGVPWGMAAVFLCVFTVGFAVSQGRTTLLAAPVWDRSQAAVTVTGTVREIEERGASWRIVLEDLVLERVPEAETPTRIRLTIRTSSGSGMAVGDRIRLRAGLLSPPPPSAPGAYDFQRAAWFEQLGAVGYAMGGYDVLPPASGEGNSKSAWDRAVVVTRTAIEQMRLTIGARLRNGIGGAEGAVAAALVTGEQGAIPAKTADAYRGSGLAHMLSISGLHFSLAAATVLVVLRAGLALISPLSLGYDVKKISAVLAIIMMSVYLAISGGSVPAQRAYIMAAVMVAAIMFDRSALSLHVLGVSALVVLLLHPEALLSASFQMSYAAVLVLIVTFDVWGARWSRWRGRAQGPLSAMGRAAVIYALGIVVSTTVAGLATAPFSLFHFQTFAAYGVLANVAAMPLVAVCIMPGLLLAVLLMPFGAEGLIFPVLRWSLAAVEVVAREVTALPGAILTAPPVPVSALLIMVVGLLVLCLWRGRGRWSGAVLMAVALIAAFVLKASPTAVAHGDGRLVAVEGEDGLILSPGRANGFARDVWERRWGKSDRAWEDATQLACDRSACLYTPAGQGEATVGFVYHESALADVCTAVPVIVASFPVPPWSDLRKSCRRTLVIDPWQLRHSGAHVIWVDPRDRGAEVLTVADVQGDRPWTLVGQSNRKRRDRIVSRQDADENADENGGGGEKDTGDRGSDSP